MTILGGDKESAGPFREEACDNGVPAPNAVQERSAGVRANRHEDMAPKGASLKRIISMRTLTIGILLNLALFPVVASLVWEMYDSLDQLGPEVLELQRLVGEIGRLNETLTMTARMAASTGSPKWEKSYRAIEKKLDDSIVAVALLAREEYEKNYASQTKMAYTQLIEMEGLALALVGQRRLAEASNILFSPGYDRQKELYSEGIRALNSAIRRRIGTEMEAFMRRVWQAGLLGLTSLLIIAGSWVGVSLVLKRQLDKRRIAQEEALAEKERLLVTLTSIADAVIATDAMGRVVIMNPAAEGITGWRKEQARARNVEEVFIALDEVSGEPCASPVEQVLRTGLTVRLRNGAMLLSRDGAKRFIEHSAAPINGPNGSVMGVALVFRDISERKQADVSLRESEEKYRAIVENIEEGYYEIDFSGSMTLFNDALTKMLGCPKEELLGMDYRSFMGEPVQRNAQEIFRRVRATGKSEWAGGWELEARDGSIRHVEASVSLAKDSEGKPCGFRGIVRDITDRMHMEAQLRRSAKMEAVGTLAGGIAHDFNNILHVILGYTEMAVADAVAENRSTKYMGHVLSAVERARELVGQILTFVRQGEQRKEITHIAPILDETYRFLRASVPATIEIRCNLNAQKDTVSGDPTQIHQILMNLCTNGAHAMRDTGGVLEISLDNEHFPTEFQSPVPGMKPGYYARLAVSDTGHGMTPEVMERIFDPYFTTKERGEGTGLGLSVVHGIVRSAGGEMNVESREGEGSSFYVYLPVLESCGAALSCEDRALLHGGGRILLVDDEQAIATMTAQMLQELGYEVSASMDPTQALDLFLDDPGNFDLVVTDMTMPKMTGKELAMKLIAIRPDLPVILCTGYSELITEDEARSLGIRRLLMKPILQNEMAAIIHQTLNAEMASVGSETKESAITAAV